MKIEVYNKGDIIGLTYFVEENISLYNSDVVFRSEGMSIDPKPKQMELFVCAPKNLQEYSIVFEKRGHLFLCNRMSYVKTKFKEPDPKFENDLTMLLVDYGKERGCKVRMCLKNLCKRRGLAKILDRKY